MRERCLVAGSVERRHRGKSAAPRAVSYVVAKRVRIGNIDNLISISILSQQYRVEQRLLLQVTIDYRETKKDATHKCYRTWKMEPFLNFVFCCFDLYSDCYCYCYLLDGRWWWILDTFLFNPLHLLVDPTRPNFNHGFGLTVALTICVFQFVSILQTRNLTLCVFQFL